MASDSVTVLDTQRHGGDIEATVQEWLDGDGSDQTVDHLDVERRGRAKLLVIILHSTSA